MDEMPGNTPLADDAPRDADRADQATIMRITRVSDGPELTPQEMEVVDARQDVLMSKESADGRPPSHWQRRLEWRWAMFGLPVLVLCAGVWAMTLGVGAGAIVGFGVLFVLVLLSAAWPVLLAGLFREEEETAARKEAIAELPQHDAQP
ncbi:MAG TPA: hypothetical protein PKE29_15205 [Phycisphaerales bacterium]|nr:hypothetical protein [Phycisphaerales bacterium]